MDGQRVFNSTEQANRPTGHPGDGLWKLMQRHMGDRAPAKHEVRTWTDGLDPRDLDETVHQIDRTLLGSGSNGRTNPWLMAQRSLATLRARHR
jgi:hypothetical protein